MNRILISLIILTLIGCLGFSSKVPEERIIPQGETIKARIKSPEGYRWVIEESESFGEFLQHLELKPVGTKILDYKKTPISNQLEHVAIIKKDIGDKDLQQCADAVIRLRADYLWDKNKQEKIEFHFTNGDLYKWNDYKNGEVDPKIRTSNKVVTLNTCLNHEKNQTII